jgi:hypothetical protein
MSIKVDLYHATEGLAPSAPLGPQFAMSVDGTKRTRRVGQSMSALPCSSDVDLFRNCESIVDLDAEISNGAFNPCMPKKELDGS